MSIGITVSDVWKSFQKTAPRSSTTLMEEVLFGWRKKRRSKNEKFWALKDINFTVESGQMLGVIGRNGAGKSTLLRLVSGIGRPDRGNIQVNGHIGALLDLGAGFHPDLTGRENVFVAAAIAGLGQRQTQKRFAQIVEFAELETFIDAPLRTYSTGMKMRLAFAIAVHTDPETLLIDEFLSVGDAPFQEKCLRHIKFLKESGCAVMLVSHNLNQVQTLCDSAIWLSQGAIKVQGSAQAVVQQYSQDSLAARSPNTQALPILQDDRQALPQDAKRFGTGALEIQAVNLVPSSMINSGDSIDIHITYTSATKTLLPIFSVGISRKGSGEICFKADTTQSEMISQNIQHRGTIKLRLERLDLTGGEYFVDVGAYDQNWENIYDYHWHMYPLTIDTSSSKKGVLNPPLKWEFRND
ncbi:MAG: ABC transporter ATP-binding protein [Leptolyngbyaceae cyanobacterium]